MLEMDILSLLDEWNIDKDKYIDIVRDIGDVCAIRKTKKGVTFRRDYERGILLIAVALHFNSHKVLEFGTGRGFVAGCLSLLPSVESIHTIDKLKATETVGFMDKLSVINKEKVNFIQKNSFKLSAGDLDNDFDLVFVDGEHNRKAVSNDFNIAIKHTTDNAIIVFDDYRNKHKEVKKYISSLQYKKCVVFTDGWIYENVMISKHGDADKVDRGRERGSGQVVLWKNEK